MSVSASEDMYVLKRNGEREIVAFDKILARLKMLGAQAGREFNARDIGHRELEDEYLKTMQEG